MNRFSAWVSVVALLVAGITIGALGMHLYQEHRQGPFPGRFGPGGPRTMARQLEEQLGLTREQSVQIREIREEGWRKGREMREQMRPLLEGQIEQTREKISKILDPEQRKIFDAWWRENRHRMHRYFLGEGRLPRRGPRFPPPESSPPEPPPPPE